MDKMPSFEEMEKTLSKVFKKELPSIPYEERQKQLEEQRKATEEIERMYSPPSWEQMQKRFTI